MKKFTLLIAMLLCFVAFGQNGVGMPTLEYPTKATQGAEKTQVSYQDSYASLVDFPENLLPELKARAASAKAKKVTSTKKQGKLQNRTASNQTINAVPAEQNVYSLGANNPVVLQRVQDIKLPKRNSNPAELNVTALGDNNPIVLQRVQEFELPKRNSNPAERNITALGANNPVYYGPANHGSTRMAPCTEENPNDFTFENGLNCSSASAFQTANDVTVAADEDFELDQITASIFANGGIALVDVIYYDNAGGLPGTVIGSELGLVPTSQAVIGSNFGFDVNEIVLDLTPFTFAGQAGVPTTYWVELSVTDGGGTGSVFWVVTSSSAEGNATAQFNGGWGIFDPAFDGVYIWGGDCTAIGGGGGGGGPCAEENPNDFTFENGLNCSSASAFQTANDVTVAADEDFELDQITASIFANGGIALVDVIYYDDAAGLPGTVIGSELGLVPTSQVVIGSNFGFDVNEIVLDLTPFTFAGQAGVPTTYWVELSVTDGGGTGSVFWVVTSSSAEGNATAQFNGGWGIFDPAFDGVYIWDGTCIPFGGGGGGPCDEENPNDFTFENGLNCSSASAFQTANDVTVAADEDFELDQITASIFANGGIALVDVIYYDDAAGLPGAVIGSEAGIVPTSQVVIGSNFGFDVNEIVLDLTPFTFAGQAGVPTTYWVELSVTDGGGTGSVFWVVTSSSAVGNPTAQFNGGWGIFDPAFDGVYIWDGECIPFGGGGGGPCDEENPNDFTFENGLNCSSASAFQTANDVTVAADEDFELDQITASIFANGGIALVDVIYYDDAAGLPGAVIGSEAGIVPTSQVVIGSNFGFDVNEIVLDLTPFTFAGQAGVPTTYWVELSVTDGGGTGSVFWVVTSSSAVGNPTAQFNGGWGIFDPAFDGVYIWDGECIPFGGGGCGEITYENVSPTGNGVPAQSFPNNPDFNSEAVDDVVLPGPDAGELCSLTITGSYTAGGMPDDPNSSVTLTVYDDNAGIPGSVVYTEDFPGSVDGDGDAIFTLEPTGAPVLNPNTTYWVSVVVNMDFALAGQFFWSSADDTNDAAALWQNPAGGFGTCTTWDTFANCAVGGGLGPDLLMTAEFIAVEIITYDDCEGAIAINCGDTVIGDTLTATADAVDDCTAGTPDAPGVWYKWTDTSGLAADVLLSTCSTNTDYDTQISVFTGPDCDNLTCVAGNDDSPNCTDFQSEVEFVSDGSSTYYILVYGFGTGTGTFELSMSCTLIPPDNDMIVNAIDLDEVECPYTDEAVAMPAATTEDGNPTDCDITGANGVWYKFTPAGDGEIFGTIVSPAGIYSVTFYTAPDETSTEDELTLVPYWNNQCVEGQSEASIPYVAGQSYYCFVLNTGGITDITFTGCENLGVEANTIEGFAFYPNPANDRLNLTSIDNIESVALYNILGQKVIDLDVNATTTQVDVSKLSVGAYIMKVSSNGQTGTYKVIKK